MFTGIIETTGTIKKVATNGSNKSFWIECPLLQELKIDQSIAHNGVCLTIEDIDNKLYKVTAIHETLIKANANSWREGSLVNLERCLAMNGRIDGHIVQGHVDTTAMLQNIEEQNGSWLLTFSFPPSFAQLVIEKGSIAINGISLTVFNVTMQTFSVAIIPYTYTHTNIQQLKTGDAVNIEFDMIGKYILRAQQVQGLTK